MNRDETVKLPDAKRTYVNSVKGTYDLFLYNLFCFVEITKHAVQDEERRQSKHLPSDQDKTFTAKLHTNALIQSLINNTKLNKLYDERTFRGTTDADFFKKIYIEFAKSDAYKAYVESETDEKADLEILLELFRLCRRNEYYNEVMEEKYINWIDDKSLVVGAIKKSLKAQPSDNEGFYEVFFEEAIPVKDFGADLLDQAFELDEDILELIKPVLDNWDHERVAIMDLIILKLACAEFLGFPTIPTKVTINEYVDIAKSYSTAKSKEFVNGVLDTLMKNLQEAGKINKEGRGLIT